MAEERGAMTDTTGEQGPTPATAADFAALDANEFAVLTTYRRGGAAVPTTVWFAHAGGRIYVQTMPVAGKVKRIRANGRVTLAPGTRTGEPLGPALGGRARVLSGEETAVAEEALARKYNQRRAQLLAQGHQGGGSTERAYIAIEPAA
jgi:uncharacterized protein